MLLKKLWNHLLPATCVLCSALQQHSRGLCEHCAQELPWLASACKVCALPLPATENVREKICGQCLQHPPAFASVTALFHYRPPIDNFIMALKFHQHLLYARLLGELLAARLQKVYAGSELPDLIIPVPLHPRRLRERGFNQALELARPVAKILRLPLDFNSCTRERVTSAQSLLPAHLRQANIKNAFKVKCTLNANHVAIVDDVITTGQTIAEFSRTLRAAGIERVDVWSIARTDIMM